ncbi:IS30 family transposase [Acetobacterium sp. KB-1]|uniref:IS30 family transposase n=1 Tax=Acetobacterium sp. KB-1 TaxID=2184575 RepID=UPI000DBEBBCC|nr:IS30 family transposase [Acetobacterium sp. KB-1]AWW27002.1 IS30 family transposase [Acetobacterium sp. KB-1]
MRKSRQQSKRVRNDQRLCIERRPEEVNQREVLNHWEMDCIESSKKEPSALLVMTERVSRKNLLFKLESKTIFEVMRVLDGLEIKMKRDFSNIFQSFTMDNGAEFKWTDGIERSIYYKKKRTTTYYCHPYSSWERGSNENANRLIRRFIPKGSDICQYSDDYIKQVENWLNNYPRKMFNYMTANEVYNQLL